MNCPMLRSAQKPLGVQVLPDGRGAFREKQRNRRLTEKEISLSEELRYCSICRKHCPWGREPSIIRNREMPADVCERGGICRQRDRQQQDILAGAGLIAKM